MAEFALQGTRNFRSLKGLPAADGRRIAGHLIMRSGHLDAMEAHDWSLLQGAGLRTVCDLRSAAERKRRGPAAVPADLRHLELSLFGDLASDALITENLQRTPGVAGAERAMHEIYERLPGALAPHLRTLVDAFTQGQAPMLIHCAVGKDRTGFTVAVLLHALGVAPDDVLADYIISAPSSGKGLMLDAHTRATVERFVASANGQPADDATIHALLDARPAYLQAALDRVNQDHGGMSRYLLTHAGLDQAAIERLRNRFLS